MKKKARLLCLVLICAGSGVVGLVWLWHLLETGPLGIILQTVLAVFLLDLGIAFARGAIVALLKELRTWKTE